MPGFMIGDGLINRDSMKQLPVSPIYTYTWTFDRFPLVSTSPTIIYAKEATLPDYQFETEEYESPSINYKYAKRITWNDVRMTYYDTVGFYKVLKKLRDKIWTTENGLAPASEYRGDSEIQVYQGDNMTSEVVWTLKNSWVKQVSWSNLTYTTSDVHSVTVTLSYDWAESA